MATYGDLKTAVNQVEAGDGHSSEFYWAIRTRLESYEDDAEMIPESYLLFMELFVTDMAKGTNLGEIDRRNKAIGLQPMILRLMALRVRAQLPDDFKAQVKQVEDELRAELKVAGL